MRTNLQRLRSTPALQRMPFLAGLFILTLGFLLLLASSTPTATATRRPVWQLVDYAQTGCVNITSPYSDRTTYYGIYLDGRWNRKVNADVTGAPSGSTSWGSYLPIRPGSSDGEYSLAYVAVQVAPDTPLGVYTFSLWASDGRTRQTVPVTVEVTDDCGY